MLAACSAAPVAQNASHFAAMPAVDFAPLPLEDAAMMPLEVAARVAGQTLDPAQVPAVSAAGVALVVTGDGTSRTLVIPGLVDAVPVAAEGETVVRFVAPPGSGERDILLDGRNAATLVVRPWTDPSPAP